MRVDESVWPKPAAARVCKSRRRFRVRARVPRGATVRSVRATLGGRRVRVIRRGRAVYADVNLRGLPRRAVRLVLRVRLRGGRTVTTRRTYRPCTRRR